jgi:hypothetical protein
MHLAAQEFPAWIGHAADVAQVIGIALAVPAAYWAYLQLKSATASAEAQAVLALDQAFSLFEQFRKDLNRDAATATSDTVTLRRYIAVFERLGLLIKKGVIGVQLADQLYGSRLATLLATAERPVRTMVAEREGKGWENFTELWTRIRRDAPHRDLPDPDQAV